MKGSRRNHLLNIFSPTQNHSIYFFQQHDIILNGQITNMSYIYVFYATYLYYLQKLFRDKYIFFKIPCISEIIDHKDTIRLDDPVEQNLFNFFRIRTRTILDTNFQRTTDSEGAFLRKPSKPNGGQPPTPAAPPVSPTRSDRGN